MTAQNGYYLTTGAQRSQQTKATDIRKPIINEHRAITLALLFCYALVGWQRYASAEEGVSAPPDAKPLIDMCKADRMECANYTAIITWVIDHCDYGGTPDAAHVKTGRTLFMTVATISGVDGLVEHYRGKYDKLAEGGQTQTVCDTLRPKN